MKKKLMKLLTCAAMLSMVLALGACGSDDDSSSDKDTGKSATKSTEKKYTYDSISDFVESPEFQSQLKSVMQSAEDQDMKMEVKGEGNKLIYVYTYKTITVDDETKAEMAAILEEGLAASASQFKSLAGSLSDEINVKNPIVRVEYVDAEGTIIYEMEYSEK